jgi:type II secretory ATPase GspE/PulE/Tfp pilus assembly ATPase PilB-like protein
LKAIEKRLAAHLLASGDLSDDNLQLALEGYTGATPLHEVLIEKGLVDSQAAIRTLAMVNGLEFVDLENTDCQKNALKCVLPEVAWDKMLVPIAFEGKALSIAMADPYDVFTPEELHIKLGCRIIVKLASRIDLRNKLSEAYGPSHDDEDQSGATQQDPQSNPHHQFQREIREKRHSSDEGQAVPTGISGMETQMENQTQHTTDSTGKNETLLEDHPKNQEPPTAHSFRTAELPAPRKPGVDWKIMERLLRHAMALRCEKVELLPGKEIVEIRFRNRVQWVHGEEYPLPLHYGVVENLRRCAGMEAGQDKDVPAHRQLRLTTPEGEISCRMQVTSTAYGDHIVIHLLDHKPIINNPLVAIGLPKEIANDVGSRLMRNRGGLLFVSAANRNSLNFLYSSLLQLTSRSGARDVMSLDTLQYKMLPGVTSAHCPDEESLLMDLENAEVMEPDVLGIQSIPSFKALKVALEVSLAGTTTIACFTAPDHKTARACLDAAEIDVMNMLRGVIGHLHLYEVKKLCPECSQPITETSTLPEWASAHGATYYQAVGCDKCEGSGYGDTALLVDFAAPNRKKPTEGLASMAPFSESRLAAALAGEIDPRDQDL